MPEGVGSFCSRKARRTGFFIATLAALVAGAVLISINGKGGQNSEPALLANVYKRLDPANPGRGRTDYPGNTVEDIPKAYAMVLMAELERSRHGIEPSLANLAEVSGRWLLDNARLDKTGAVGWGVPIAWDAYGDGSINPANTVYSISTGIVADALLNWMETTPEAPSEQILTAVHAALSQFAPVAMRTPSGLLPYSLRQTDRQYDTFNSAAYLAGQMQRFAKYADRDAESFRIAADSTMASLIKHHQVSSAGNWYWQYSVQENVSNDLAHASYIVDGIKTYIEEGGRLANQLPLDAIVAHLAEFEDDTSIRGWPTFQANIEAPARLYDIGMALHFGCQYPRLNDLAARVRERISDYRTDEGFSRYPPKTDAPDIVVNEYETYLWRGLITCEVSHMLGSAKPATPTAPSSVAAKNKGKVPFTSTALPSSEIILKKLDDGEGGVSIVRHLPENRLEISGLGGRGLPIVHSVGSAPELRAAVIHDGDLLLVYYDNPTLANYLARYRRAGATYEAISSPLKLPSLQDPAGHTYEMIPAVFLLSQGPVLHVVGGTLHAEIIGTTLAKETRLNNCSRVIEAVLVQDGPIVLCVQKVAEGERAPFKLIGSKGTSLPELGDGVPFNLRIEDRQVRISSARSGEDFAKMLRFDLERLSNGWLEFGIDNTEGRIPWSQIYYLNGFLDLLLVAASDSNERWKPFSELLTDVRTRLDQEIQLLNEHWLAGRYRTKAFSVDRSLQIFAVQSARLLLLFDRYKTELLAPEELSAFEDLRNSVVTLKEHIDRLVTTGELHSWIPPGTSHLAWPFGSAFYFDGLNVPYNHQNEWAYALIRSAPNDDHKAALDIITHFLRRIAPDGILPLKGGWDYWWGRAYDGWTKEMRYSMNTPAYAGDHGKAWISFRSIDAMSAMAAAQKLPPNMARNLYSSCARLLNDGKIYPFVSYELRRAGYASSIPEGIAMQYIRISSPWEVQNAVWAYEAVVPRS